MDILMTAQPTQAKIKPGPQQTIFLTTKEFFATEDLFKQYDQVLWQAFNTHGKYQDIVSHADYFSVATDDQSNYLASAFVVEIGSKWLIEYVMADPSSQNKGAGTSVMSRIMNEAKDKNIDYVILNCDPDKENGKLPLFYGKFGFKAA